MTGTNPDPVTRAMIRLLKSRGDVWDEPPGLYLAYRDGDRAWISPRSMVPQHAWTLGPPAAVLGMVADSVRDMGNDPQLATELAVVVAAHPEFCGAVFCTEMWFARPSDPVARAAVQERRLYQHPNRTEARCAWACLRDGTVLNVTQPRGKTPTADAYYLDGPDARTVPAALEIIVRALATAGAN